MKTVGNTLTVGRVPNYWSRGATDEMKRKLYSVEHLKVEYIGENAFEGLKFNLKSLTANTIGSDAFKDCHGTIGRLEAKKIDFGGIMGHRLKIHSMYVDQM